MEDNKLESEELKELEEAMKLYEEISDIFIRHNTSLKMSFSVLTVMSDMIYNYMALNTEEIEE